MLVSLGQVSQGNSPELRQKARRLGGSQANLGMKNWGMKVMTLLSLSLPKSDLRVYGTGDTNKHPNHIHTDEKTGQVEGNNLGMYRKKRDWKKDEGD